MLIYIRPDSITWHLFYILSTCGEYPLYSLEILGNKREYNKRVLILEEENTFLNMDTRERCTCKAVSVSGKGRLKKIRLTQESFPILRWIGTYDYYMKHFHRKAVQNNYDHIDRAHRIAETNAMMYAAGIPFTFDEIPELKNTEGCLMLPARAMKFNWDSDANVLCYSRITGGLRLPDGFHPVYNARWSRMKWNGDGERKLRAKVENMIWQHDTNAILFGKSYDVGQKTILQRDSNNQSEKFFHLFNNITFLPLNSDGVKLLKLMTVQNYRELFLANLFPDSTRSYGKGHFVYDAYLDGRYILSFLDSNLTRLNYFLSSIGEQQGAIACFKFQKEFILSLIGNKDIKVKVIPFEKMAERLINSEGRNDEQ